MIQLNSTARSLETALSKGMTGDYRQDLETIANSALKVMVERRKEILASLFEAERLPEMRELVVFVPQQLRQMLRNFLKRQIERGVMRPMNEELAAQAFLGMLLSYSISLGLLPEGLSRMTTAEVAEQFAEIFLHGTQ